MGEQLMDHPIRYELAQGMSQPRMDEALLHKLLSLDIPTENTNEGYMSMPPVAPSVEVISDSTPLQRPDAAFAAGTSEAAIIVPETTDVDNDFAAWEAVFAQATDSESVTPDDDFDILTFSSGTGWMDAVEREVSAEDAPEETSLTQPADLSAGEQAASDMLDEQFKPAEVARKRRRIVAAVLGALIVAAPFADRFIQAGRTSGGDARMVVMPNEHPAPPAPEIAPATLPSEPAPAEITTTTLAPVAETAPVDLNAIAQQRIAENAEADRLAAEKLAQEKAAAEQALQEMAAAEKAANPRYMGDKYKLMEAAGIPESDWYYVDCVIAGCEGVSAEGGWDGVQRWNTAGSGAYGICQALPASKMASAGSDYMTNIVTQLKWCNGYAQEYGGWKEAWEFRQCTGRCYSSRTGGTVYKDHTWW